METSEGVDESVWHQMADELGLQGINIPAEYGGSGFGFPELTMILEQMGYFLLCSPYFSTVVLAAGALLCSHDDSACQEWLPGIASGKTIATLAHTEETGKWDTRSVETTAVRETPDEYELTGHKMFVTDGCAADLILVSALAPGGLSLFSVSADDSGLLRSSISTTDHTRKSARLDLSGARGRLVGGEGDGEVILRKTLSRAAVALAAEQIGGAQRCLDMAVEYAKNRVQFGRPIGSFQVIKHKCADMLLEVESGRSAAYYASWIAEKDSPEFPTVSSIAKFYCSDAFFHTAAENIQIHGGIGLTWDHDAQLYFKRAKSSELMLGDPNYHRELVAQQIGL